MTKLLVKAAAILVVSELAVMFFLRFSEAGKLPSAIVLDPLLMLLLALGPLYLLLRDENAKLKRREALDSKLHSIITELWNASLHTFSTEDLLKRILKEILENSPISIQRKGAIFLVEEGVLRLKVSEGFSQEHKRLCNTIPPGKCICGIVLETGELAYAEAVDDRHQILPPGITPHAHYCLPIRSGALVIGALNLYLEPGHRRQEDEEKFLRTVCSIVTRIIEGKKVERALFQMQKMESLNQFAAGIAHDFNNILGAIQGYCDVTTRALPPGSQSACDIEEICKAVGRGEALTRQLKLFSRQAKEEDEIFDVNTELESSSRMIRSLMGSGISVEFRFPVPASPLRIRGNRNQLQQVLMNLAVNAKDAMPTGGRFIIRSCSKEVCFTSSKKCFSSVCITAEDTGAGMREEILERIFEPFFTTKPQGKGSGLGLAITHGIVQQHGGEIMVRSAPGEGTRFDIYLPLTEGSKTEQPQVAQQDLKPDGDQN